MTLQHNTTYKICRIKSTHVKLTFIAQKSPIWQSGTSHLAKLLKNRQFGDLAGTRL